MQYYYLAQVESGYGCSNYGTTDAYSSCEVAGTSTEAGGATGLVNTGSPATFALSAGLILVAVVLAVKFWPKKKSKSGK